MLTLPKGTIHVISDIHGEDKKLRHVINNASGTLRPLIERMFSKRMDAKQFQEFLTLSFYPAEVIERMEQSPLPPEQTKAFALRTLKNQFELVRVLTARYSLKRAMEVYPPEYMELLIEMLIVSLVILFFLWDVPSALIPILTLPAGPLGLSAGTAEIHPRDEPGISDV